MWDTTRVCPNCGSTDVGVDRSNVISMMALDTSYECGNCGYAGIFPEVDNDAVGAQQEEIRERGSIIDTVTPDTPGHGRLMIGALFLLVGLPPAVYATSVEGRIAGLLSLAIGGGIFFDYLRSLSK